MFLPLLMLISLYQLYLFVVWTIGTSLNAVAYIFINAFNRHSTSILCVASCRHLVVVIPGWCHDNVRHLSRWSTTYIATHNVLDDSGDFTEWLSFLVIPARRRGIRFWVVVSLTGGQYHPSVSAVLSTKSLIGCHCDIVCWDLLRLLLSKLRLVWIVITLALRTVNRDNVWEIETVLNGRSSDVWGICAQILHLLLLNLFNTFASKVLKISEATIVLDVVYHCGKILLLLLVLWWSNCLIHHVNIIMWLCSCRYVLKVI